MDATLTLLINGSDNVYLNGVAMLATKVWIWIPLYIAILSVLYRQSRDWRQFCILLCSLLLVVVIADQVASCIFKPLVCRWRPSHDPEIQHLVDIVNGYRGGKYGFFSSHASNTMGITVFLSLLFRQRLVTLTLLFWSLLNCWTRVYLGLHYVGDITVGLLFGAFVGYMLYTAATHIIKQRQTAMSPTLASGIYYTFVITLLIICIPWKVYL